MGYGCDASTWPAVCLAANRTIGKTGPGHILVLDST